MLRSCGNEGATRLVAMPASGQHDLGQNGQPLILSHLYSNSPLVRRLSGQWGEGDLSFGHRQIRRWPPRFRKSIRCRTSGSPFTTPCSKQERFRYLLADNAGAGKKIITGLDIREILSRWLLKRV